MAPIARLLVVEDEVKVATFIKKGLETQSYSVDVAYDGREGKRLFSSDAYDLIVLDVNLPFLSGLELAEYIRSKNASLPILMLTALDTTTDKLLGFEAGADDYLVKPFEFLELIARVKALLRRHSGPADGRKQKLQFADLELDLDAKVARRQGDVIELTAREFTLLDYLMQNPGRVVSRIDIAQHVWDINFDTGTNVIDVYVNYLRNKVDKPYNQKLIHTVIGMGYVLKDK
ncbi:response regulator transcription factor [Rudanella lutea]|uniref:response regulator transcription factor n=1 Tax=Rudanella lutea TaxID=451374 RepID=UPI00037E7D8E|nr:response regulator transcription factor [Rudanella lutea]